LKTGTLIASGPDVTKVTAPETACGCVGGRKLWREFPRADPAWNKAGKLEAE
jgi:hypothetical protein